VISDKQLFLIAYDYGMGGLWGVMWARSEEEIQQAYPEVNLVKEWPSWMDDEDYARLTKYDIDDPPKGLLKAVLADRTHD
jgi:hypothetical protein